jgi:DNA-binding winged helix-turn-helix (wHTH) protein
VDPVSGTPASVQFGRFRILPHRREVLANCRPIELGGRAYDMLMVLIEANGAVVSKDELMSRVWPGRVVEEGNLRAQIRALRISLGEPDLIRTVPGRGYQFTSEVRSSRGTSEVLTDKATIASTVTEAPQPPLPVPEKPSIAVLPFENMSGDPNQDFLPTAWSTRSSPRCRKSDGSSSSLVTPALPTKTAQSM